MRALLIAGALALANFSALAAENMPYMELTTGSAAVPVGWEGSCEGTDHADECTPASFASRPVALTEVKMQELQRINDEVNKRLAGTEVICVNFAREKRNALIAANWPRDRVLLTVVHLPEAPQNVSHMVVTVSTDKGDYVLDSFIHRYKVILWSQTRYQFLSRQLGTREGWAHIEDTRFPPQVAAK